MIFLCLVYLCRRLRICDRARQNERWRAIFANNILSGWLFWNIVGFLLVPVIIIKSSGTWMCWLVTKKCKVMMWECACGRDCVTTSSEFLFFFRFKKDSFYRLASCHVSSFAGSRFWISSSRPRQIISCFDETSKYEKSLLEWRPTTRAAWQWNDGKNLASRGLFVVLLSHQTSQTHQILMNDKRIRTWFWISFVLKNFCAKPF